MQGYGINRRLRIKLTPKKYESLIPNKAITIYYVAQHQKSAFYGQLKLIFGFIKRIYDNYFLYCGPTSHTMAEFLTNQYVSIISSQPHIDSHENESQYATFLQCIIDSSLVALRQMTRHNIIESPCYRLLTLSFKKSLNPSKIEPIDVKFMKTLANEATKKTAQLDDTKHNQLICSSQQLKVKLAPKDVFILESFNHTLKQQFNSFIATIIQKIRSQLQNHDKLNNMDIVWNQKSLDEIFENNTNMIKACKSIKQILCLAKPEIKFNSVQPHQVPSYQTQTLQFKKLLSKMNGSIQIKVELYKLFEKKASLLQMKEKEKQKWILCCKDLEITVKSQMQEIQTQNKQNQRLEDNIQQVNQQLAQNEERIRTIEAQMADLQKEMKEIKQPTAIQTDSYYINPMFEKAQMQEKLLMEMIEVQADLLLGKEQIRLMTDSIVDIIKLSLYSLDDLQASKYFLANFNRSVYRITKDIKSLQNVDMEQLLSLKQDTHSFYDSEFCMEQTRRSQISTRSEIQFDQKLSRITEDDSVSAFQE